MRLIGNFFCKIYLVLHFFLISYFRWFYGFISAKQAEKLLKGNPAFTFLIRFSQNKPGNIVITCINSTENNCDRKLSVTQDFSHITVEATSFKELRVLETEKNSETIKTFLNFENIIEHYSLLLKIPLSPAVSNQNGFHRMVCESDVNELLTKKPVGTYLFRFGDSSRDHCKPGDLFLSFVDENEKIQHIIILQQNGFTLTGDCHTYDTLSDLVKESNFCSLSEPLSCTNLLIAKRMSVISTLR